jgi:hypothetical protein
MSTNYEAPNFATFCIAVPRLCDTFRHKLEFLRWGVLRPRPIPMLGDLLLPILQTKFMKCRLRKNKTHKILILLK